MKKCLLLGISVVAFFFSKAQSDTRPTYVINPGETISSTMKFEDLYQYPSFTSGEVHFRNGSVTNARLNYSYLEGAIQFIDPKGDTLTLANENEVTLIKIANDSFYFHNSYLQLADRLPDGNSIYRKTFLRLATVRKVGLFDQPVDGGAVENVSTFMAPSQDRNLPLRQKITLVRETFLYVTDKYEHLILVATRKNIEKLYPKQRDAISTYLAENKVNFQNVDQVRDLLSYLRKHA